MGLEGVEVQQEGGGQEEENHVQSQSYTRKGEKASVRRGIWDEDTNVEVYPTHS